VNKFFVDNGYFILKNAISKEICNFGIQYYDYLINSEKMKKEIEYLDEKSADFFKDSGYAYASHKSSYSETLLENDIFDIVENITNLKLYPTYSYARIYLTGNKFPKHIDRDACRISTSLHLGSVNCNTPWPLYLNNYDGKTIEVLQYPGDIIIYNGFELQHWRDEFTMGDRWYQVMNHYHIESGHRE
tara:strand:- start:239 stop:802 length:564 start_codon:yes stop_codon:yes gene_type:complete